MQETAAERTGLAVTISSRSPRCEIAPGLFSPVQIQVDWRSSDSPYRVVATVRPVNGRFEAVDVMLLQIPGGPPVTRGGVVAVPITDIVAEAASELSLNDPEWASQLQSAELTADELAMLQRGNPDDEGLRVLARAYRILRTYEPNPTSALQAELGVHPKSLSRWLAKAQAAGYLTAAERGRRREAYSPTRTPEALDALANDYWGITLKDLRG